MNVKAPRIASLLYNMHWSASISPKHLDGLAQKNLIDLILSFNCNVRQTRD